MKEGLLMVNVIGLGYIGLPTALMLASSGVSVCGTDKNPELVNKLNNGEITFEEKGLVELFNKSRAAGISFSTLPQICDMYIVAVPSPYLKESKKLDPSYVIDAVKGVLKVAPEGAIIVIESTISPGSIDRFVRPVLRECNREDVSLCHAPERIIPGNMVYELEHNSRTIGADRPEVARRVKEVYESFCKGEIITTTIKTAEMTKVVENTYRDVNIAFANELLKICRSDNMDVHEIIRIANKHPRVNILSPGPGVGGHCISVDPWFLVGDYPGLPNIILTARQINDSMPEYVLSRIADIKREKGDLRVGLYGLTYKEDVDDTRESPTLQLLSKMKSNLAEPLAVYDPMVKTTMVDRQYHDIDAFLNDVDMVVIMVNHSELKNITHKLDKKVILDTRNTGLFGGAYKL